MTNHHCPICKTIASRQIAGSPYFECPSCLAWFQSPFPRKVYHGPQEPDVDGMSEGDRKVNEALAASLFQTAMRGRKGLVLDIGAKLPVLAAAFVKNHDCAAMALDAEVDTGEVDGVQMIRVDFETADARTLGHFDLITMVHVFEHMHKPLDALRKLRRLVADDGRVFLRLPDHSVPGWERDLTPHHYTIHPFYHCLPSIMECLAQVRDCFVIESTYPMVGAGQRDIVLRPITKRPKIACAMIVKNEERDLPRALKSMESFVDAVAIADTGSTDRTLIVAHTTIDKHIVSETYLGASERDEGGDWKLWDFSKARNHALTVAEGLGCDWVMWADADDEIKTPPAFRRAPYLDCYDTFKFWIESGGARWYHNRMWRASSKVRFHGMCHEFPAIDGLRLCAVEESLIKHHDHPVAGTENSNPRNLRILLRQWDDPTYAKMRSRTAFYLGNTYRDVGKHEEAARWYRERIGFKEAYRDEMLFAYIELARQLRALKRFDEADAACREALTLAPDWAEFKMELARTAYAKGEYDSAIAWASEIDTAAPIPKTELWREVPQYRDQPPRMISWCYEHKGNIERAVFWAGIAAARIDGLDTEWSNRTRRLIAQWDAQRARGDEPAAPAIVKQLRPLIALHRPGAIGDILMTLNLVPLLKAFNPDAEIHYFCDGGLARPEQLGSVILQAGCAMVLDHKTLPAWRSRYSKVVDLVGYPVKTEGYPEHAMSKHLLRYFGEEMGLDSGAWRGALPALTVGVEPLESLGDYFTIQVRAGWSKYKQWPIEWWNAVLGDLRHSRGHLTPILIGAEDEPTLKYVDRSHVGLPLSHALRLFAGARFHLGIDSFPNHLSNYFWHSGNSGRRVRAAILWGSTQANAAGYAHNVNIVRPPPEGCQPCFKETAEWSQAKRGPCENSVVVPLRGNVHELWHKCMAEISVPEVRDAARELADGEVTCP